MPMGEVELSEPNVSGAAAGGPRRVVARAPTRIDFGGGWTDVPPYSEEEGGCVCNLAIARYATARLEVGGEPAGGAGAWASGADSALAEAALRRARLVGGRLAVESD